eukprot:m.346501 g.346501  ORF g.346501 m.346501 type:complete len:212 (+) comp29421_c0_seq1:282-917(+)
MTHRYELQQAHALQLLGDLRSDVNIGTSVSRYGVAYRWEGDVKKGKANGFGKLTWTSGLVKGVAFYGEYKNGSTWGNHVIVYTDGHIKFVAYQNGRFKSDTLYESNNPLHNSTMKKAKERSAEAWALVLQPWSPTTNNWGKWKHLQDTILTVMLVGQRLHYIELTGTTRYLRSLPTELWEMILQFVLANSKEAASFSSSNVMCEEIEKLLG